MTFRLPWQRNSEGGFIAYPEGERLKDRVAKINKDETSLVPWHWWISYDDAKRSDHAKAIQAAANAATEEWPRIKAEAARLAALAAEAEALRTNVQRMMRKGDLALSVFGIETASSDRLRKIIALATDAGGLGG